MYFTAIVLQCMRMAPSEIVHITRLIHTVGITKCVHISEWRGVHIWKVQNQQNVLGRSWRYSVKQVVHIGGSSLYEVALYIYMSASNVGLRPISDYVQSRIGLGQSKIHLGQSKIHLVQSQIGRTIFRPIRDWTWSEYGRWHIYTWLTALETCINIVYNLSQK